MDKYNKILVEFDFLIDLDLAMYKFIRCELNNPEFVDQKFINMNEEKDIIKTLISRKVINPLNIIMPNNDTDNLYEELINSKLENILKYAKAYDTFGLMITFLREASSVDITVLCENKIQQSFINKLNDSLNTIVMKRCDVPLNKYNILYVKYFPQIMQYRNVCGKHIYIANAGFNLEDNGLPLYYISAMVGDINIIHTIDLYRDVKYYIRKEENKNE